MYTDGKWACQLRALQKPDGSWGPFHSMSQTSGATFTTEQALRRLDRLGCGMEDPCIQRAVSYMEACLKGEMAIPDPTEKGHNWDIFVSLMLAAWIRRFTTRCAIANQVADRWHALLCAGFENGRYHQAAYEQAFMRIFSEKPRGGRMLDFVHFYPLSLLRGYALPDGLIPYMLRHPAGVYYIYELPLCDLPPTFASRQASRYLAALELLAAYPQAKEHLSFAADWLMDNRLPDGSWDMGAACKDQIYFPLSDHWRAAANRKNDCTWRIQRFLSHL